MGRFARAGSMLARALVGQRPVGREDRGWVVALALILFGLAGVGFFAPRIMAWPVGFLLFWLGVASLFRAWASERGGG
jgi:cardiolipin synthase